MNERTRREILRSIAIGTLCAIAPEVLAGCGSGGNGGAGNDGNGGAGNGGAGVNPAGIPGTVNTSEIGGIGLTVNNSAGSAISVGSTGTFAITVSSVGAQLISVSDASNRLRGLALSVPGGAPSITIDATSTAIALLILSPGILSTNVREATARVITLKNLPGFVTLQSFLQANLHASPLQSLIAQGPLSGLVTTCITQYIAGANPNIHKRAMSQDGSFSAAFKSSSTPTSTSVLVSNSGWRWIRVARQPLDVSNHPITSASFANLPGLLGSGYMAGASPASWGSIFLAIGSPTTATDTNIDLANPSNQSILEYFADGPGFGSSSAVFPLSAGVGAIGLTVLFYCAFPILDLFLGKESLLNADALAPQILGILEEGLTTQALFEASNPAEFASASLNFVVGALGMIAGSGMALETLGIALELGPPLAAFLTLVSVGLATYNLIVAAYYLMEQPAVVAATLNDSGLSITVS